MSIIRNAFRRSALRPRIGLNEVLQWVGSGSSSRALEGALFRIELTFTRQASLGPQQPISVALPQRAISVTVSIRRRSRVRI